MNRLIEALDAALPQTQCTRCGEPDCRRYAEAIALREAPINRCPPGGDEGVARLAALTGRQPLPLDAEHGVAAERGVARIDEAWCIGCTLCIQACPVDAIIGASKQMHVVIEADCTGCELCIPVCPVDCIELPSVTPGLQGWAAWSPMQADEARARYQARQRRHSAPAPAPAVVDKQALIAAALARARSRESKP